LLELVVLFDMMAVGVGCAVSASRGIFAMARDRRIPAPLARVSKRYDTPVGAIFFVVGAVGVAVILDQFAPSLFALPQTPHYFALFAWGSTFGGFALVVVYLLMAVGSIRSFARAQGRFLIFFAALVGIAITGGAIYGSFYKVTSPTIVAPWCALIWLAVGLIVAFASKGRTPASMHLADLAANPDLARTEPLTVGDASGPFRAASTE
jgi:amino acid transporter